MHAVKDALVTLICRFLSPVFCPFLRRHLSTNSPSSILIVKPCCIGDVLMATPTVAQVRAGFPRARITFAIGNWSREVLENNPKIDELVDCRSIGSGTRTSVRDYLAFVRQLRRGDYDACLVLDRSPLLTMLPFLAGVPNRIGIDSQGRGFSLTHKVPCQPDRHEAELYLDTARALGLSFSKAQLEFFPSPDDIAWAEMRLAEAFPTSEQRELPLVAIHPGGGINPGMNLTSKRWLPERYAILADRLIKSGARTVLVGAMSDRTIVTEVLSKLSGLNPTHASAALDLSGTTTLGQLGAVLRQCHLFVGNDAGPMHLATAVGTPVVAIFGPTDPALCGPLGAESVTVYKKLTCSPCFANGRMTVDCTEYRCMEAVSVDDVWQRVRALLWGDR